MMNNMYRPEISNTADFVILQSLQNQAVSYGGQYFPKFFTTNNQETDLTKLFDGTVAYKILGYAETVKEAQLVLGLKEQNDY